MNQDKQTEALRKLIYEAVLHGISSGTSHSITPKKMEFRPHGEDGRNALACLTDAVVDSVFEKVEAELAAAKKFRVWYESAMKAGREAGFGGLNAAGVIKELAALKAVPAQVVPEDAIKEVMRMVTYFEGKCMEHEAGHCGYGQIEVAKAEIEYKLRALLAAAAKKGQP